MSRPSRRLLPPQRPRRTQSHESPEPASDLRVMGTGTGDRHSCGDRRRPMVPGGHEGDVRGDVGGVELVVRVTFVRHSRSRR